jgi:poly(ADP-ribose) glycohydrolase
VKKFHCKHFASPHGCREGDRCKYAHGTHAHGAHATGTHAHSTHAHSPGSPPRPVVPGAGTDWAEGYVRMPWSAHNVSAQPGADGVVAMWPRTVALLSETYGPDTSALEALLTALLPPDGVADVNTQYAALTHAIGELEGLQRTEFFCTTLPWMKRTVAAAPALFPDGVPVLRQNLSQGAVMTQQQVAALLCCAFFSLFPFRHRPIARPRPGVDVYAVLGAAYAARLPSFNFGSLWGMEGPSAHGKVRCLLEYFFQRSRSHLVATTPLHVEVLRCVGTSVSDAPASGLLATCAEPLAPLEVRFEGSIEDSPGVMEADFANKLLGGGVLGRGCVQEEIRFAICPEMIVSRMLCEEMLPNEAVLISGARQYSTYAGYSDTFRFAGAVAEKLSDVVTHAASGRRAHNVCLTALDAANYSAKNYKEPAMAPEVQLEPAWVERDAMKAYVAFRGSPAALLPAGHSGPIATGNWGCGAFAGNLELKGLMQLCAAGAVGRPIIYYPFDKPEFGAQLVAVHAHLAARKVSVGDLYGALLSYHTVCGVATASDAAPSAEARPTVFDHVLKTFV